jgi:hypothetical protein
MVFQPVIESCAWLYFDSLCCSEGWPLLRELARVHGDESVHVICLERDEPLLLTFSAGSDEDAYHAQCEAELIGADVVRWWGSSGQWGIYGSRSYEIAVMGQVVRKPWPQTPDCEVFSIDAAMTLCQGGEGVREQLVTTYDSLSWDPAVGDHEALPQLLALCNNVALDRVDPVVAIRALLDLLERVSKSVRRIDARSRLRQAWTRTGYLMLDAEVRRPWGELLLAVNDRNHERHSSEERELVRQACEEIAAAAERA